MLGCKRPVTPLSDIDIWGYETSELPQPARVAGLPGLEAVQLPPVVNGSLAEVDPELDALLRLRDAAGPLE